MAFKAQRCNDRRVVQVLHRQRLADRFDERLRERKRIARELHDTVLQAAQSLLLSVHALSGRLSTGDPMRHELSRMLLRADELMAQGRDRIQNLRKAAEQPIELAQSLASAWRDLGRPPGFRICVEGAFRRLESNAADEIALIAREALANAALHSSARSIEARIVYADDGIRLSVSDDGIGMPPACGGTEMQPGHCGLAGMRERAATIRSVLSVDSAPGIGVRIKLFVPAAVAYFRVGS